MRLQPALLSLSLTWSMPSLRDYFLQFEPFRYSQKPSEKGRDIDQRCGGPHQIGIGPMLANRSSADLKQENIGAERQIGECGGNRSCGILSRV